MMVCFFIIKILIKSHLLVTKHILAVDLEKINLDNNFDEDDLGTIIHVRLLGCRNNFKNRKALKKR